MSHRPSWSVSLAKNVKLVWHNSLSVDLTYVADRAPKPSQIESLVQTSSYFVKGLFGATPPKICPRLTLMKNPQNFSNGLITV